MNTNNVKRYAPKARTAFIAAMTKRAALFGIRESSIPSMGIEPLEQKGDLALIGDRPFPASIIRPRAALVKKVEQMGFAQAMEQAAYSWFNRLCAIRYMELKGYLDHGRRVLSHPDHNGGFQILDDCLDIELEGLDRQRVAELKLEGTKDEELYRELLLAQCHALHKAMPFLFEAVDDATELLLPDNLTKTDSLIRELVEAIPEEDWQEVEIIGWLYQFYISEKKDQVIGKVVKSEDIPAATQLFTPNWIVQYLVQNSVGRQWLQTYPDSPLKAKMPYYIEPAEQAPEVQAQLAAITPESIDPLTIKVLDPACGSGHILVEAYKVLKEIYTERGFRSRDIPQLILENNLFGLDIDDRAGQLAGFALMMLAREDDRRIFSRELKLNVLALQESRHLDLDALWRALNLSSDWQRGQSQSLFDTEQGNLATAQADNRYQLLKAILQRFIRAKTFGSLNEVPSEEASPLAELLAQLSELASTGDSMQKPAAEALLPYVQQAWILAQRYDAVIANPPYMGSKGMNADLKDFAKKAYPNSKSDLFAIFMERAFTLLKPQGFNAQINMQSWMFLSSYEQLREWLLKNTTLITMAHLGARAFGQISGEVVQTTVWVLSKQHFAHYQPVFFRLVEGDEEDKKLALLGRENRFDNAQQDDFKNIPGQPISYWVSSVFFETFRSEKIGSLAVSEGKNVTSDNDRFIRNVWEVSSRKLGGKWYPCSKGGSFRKWYGNTEHVMDWSDSARKYYRSHHSARIVEEVYWYKPAITWTDVNSNGTGFRLQPENYVFESTGPASVFKDDDSLYFALAVLNSSYASEVFSVLNPTIHIKYKDVFSVPYPSKCFEQEIISTSRELVGIFKEDWDLSETSIDFTEFPLVSGGSIKDGFIDFLNESRVLVKRVASLESKINKSITESFAISGEIRSEVHDSQVTLNRNPLYGVGGATAEDEVEVRFQSEILCSLVSYTIGCIMGRYSLDQAGLVYAHAENYGFAELVAEGAYKTFPADSDGILPLTDQEWFADDATNRFRQFVRTVWGEGHLQENLNFVAESLCLYAIKPKRGESALDTIRRYLSTQFFKDHLKTYKKRPIYWLFSSGKHKAFECLVYLHRYNEGTLARMRTEYVIPLTAKLNTYANKLEQDIEASTSTAEKKALEKQLATLHNQQAELATFDEKLRHYADQRISLDLDDGVKVNYGKFGDLLAEVGAITGEK
ncbi:BREX-1 system adenine-specific DNA-methyltransferase PglX [Pseudomonas aeruginosa]|uniref:BREX-1 system adenine-specific DNA-methyltransferase PglX n=2 Tax=Pseudomonas aeruginosa TaxID=287 RepID=UPI00249E2196|nr:BREX-1 system adenine-specific DNA-methyltransferase PglX [Pseudomonas aeruginosa]EIZ0544860.1 BREX-1 system adenine-specific DNA-methyltransferase PglX [Pseudomonas aeruginosa]WGX70004.1 BREX-1 system adenine-specific DNA-methyltransferase PglX [Pseudomonas aeruginosa]